MKSTKSKAAGWIAAACVLLAAAAYLASIHTRRHIDDRVYRIGWEDDPPFQEKGQDGAPTGLAVELVRNAARRGGVRLEWVWRPASSEEALRSRKVDLWPLITITPERRRVIHISDPYMQHENCLLVRAGSPYSKAEDLSGATISYYYLPINEHLLHSAAPGARIIPRHSTAESIADVCEQRADAAFLDEFTGISVLLGGKLCSGQPLRLISHPALLTHLGVGSTMEAAPVADLIRDGIASAAQDGELSRTLTRWGYLSSRNLDTMTALLNARQRERWEIAVIALFAFLLGLTLFAADRIRRQKNRIKKTEQAFRESEEKLRLMANNLNEMVLAYDMDRRLVFANPAVEKLTGYSIASLRDHGCISVVHPDDKARVRRLFDSLFQGPCNVEAEFRLISKNGHAIWISATWGPILDDEGRQVGVQGSERDITARKQAEEALRGSELRFRELLEGVQLLAIMIDSDGFLSFCNDYTLAITGWAAEEIIGHPATNFLDPEHLRRLAEGIDASELSSEGTILMKTGARRWIQWSSTVLRDGDGRIAGLASLGADVTELQSLRAEAARRESEATFRNLADTAPVMIWVAGVDKSCTFFNKGWLAFTGRTMEQELGDGWAESVYPDDRDHCIATYTSAFDARRSFQMEYRLRRTDAQYRWVLDTGIPRFGPGDTFAGYIGSCTDITDLKRTQEEDLARQKLESVGRLAGGIAHDFNNLLGGVLAQADLAAEELEGGGCPSDELKSIRAVAIRGAGIVRQLMIYAGQENAAPELVDTSRVVEDMAELLKVVVSKHAVMKINLCDGLPAVRANPAQLRQVVMNLITNASEAIGERDGVIAISTARVTVGPNSPARGSVRLPAGEYVQLEVSDTGCGMTLDAQARAFDPFFSTKSAGHGLGLSVVQGIVRVLGGAVHLASEPGRGSTFRILLPAAGDPIPAPSATAAPATKQPSETAAGTVLVVEDEAPLRLAVSKVLRKKGFSVIEAGDGTTALDLIRTYGDSIGVVLLDITLPGIPSRDVFAEARRLQPDIKVIVTSAYGQNKVDATFPGLRVDHFIRKPYQLGDLAALLRNILAESATVPRR